MYLTRRRLQINHQLSPTTYRYFPQGLHLTACCSFPPDKPRDSAPVQFTQQRQTRITTRQDAQTTGQTAYSGLCSAHERLHLSKARKPLIATTAMSNDHVQDFINRMASGHDPLGIIDSIIRDDIREREEEDRLIRAAIMLAARELVAQHEDEEDDDELEEDEDDDGDEDETTASSESSSGFATLETPTPMLGHARPRAPARRSLQIPGRASARVLSGMPPPTQERVLSTMPSTMVDSWVSSQRQLLSQSQARARTHAPSQSQPQPQAHSQAQSQAQSQPQATAQQSSQAMPPPQAPFQFGGLDRRAMERERLERLAKRKGPSAAQKDDEAKAKDASEDVVEISPPKRQTTTSVSAGMGKSTSELEQQRQDRVAKRQRPSSANKDDENSDDDVVEIPPPKRQAAASTSAAKGTESKPTASVPAPASASPAAPQSSLPYPNGTVKRTWARGCARTGDDITIEEVFQKDHLELALLSSFQWDEEWMLSKLDISRTKLLLLAFAKDEAQVCSPISLPSPSLPIFPCLVSRQF